MSVPIKLEFQFDDDVVEALGDAIKAAPKTMETFVKKSLPHGAVAELRRNPRKPKYPLKWRSDKQRRFVMAKLRRANNLPYRRTGKLSGGWKLVTVISRETITVSLDNEVPYAGFVVGGIVSAGKNATLFTVRQPMFPHWPDAREVWARHTATFEDQLIQAWFDILEARPGTFA
jgi:hypothetical protein